MTTPAAGRTLRILTTILCLLTLGTDVAAQRGRGSRVKHYSVQDGLSQGVINSITQDEQGLIWLATEDGLNRFDGYAFKVFKNDPDDTVGLADNFVQHVFKDKHEQLWISSRKGLHHFNPLTEQFQLYRHADHGNGATPANDVSFIAQAGEKQLWVAWYGNAFASFDPATQRFRPYSSRSTPAVSGAQTLTLLEDSYGLLWVGTQDKGLEVFKVNNGTVIRAADNLHADAALPARNVRCLEEDAYGNIWIGTAQGLVLYLRQHNRFYSFNQGSNRLAGHGIFALLADSREHLWVGLQGGGLYSLDLRQLQQRSPEELVFTPVEKLGEFNIARRTIQALYEDRDKNLWVGTFGDGVYMISSVEERFSRIQAKQYNGDAFSFVQYYGICYDQQGDLWLGTDGDGIYHTRTSGEVVKHYAGDGRHGLTDNAILSACRDHRQQLWFGSYAHGIFQYNAARDVFLPCRYTGTFAGGRDVRVIMEDSRHRLWAGTNRGGLCRIDPTTRTYQNVAGLSGALYDGDIRAIAEDRDGSLWIGCYGDGLYHYNPETGVAQRHPFSQARQEDDLKSNVVFAVHVDASGRVWIGTGGGGLGVYDPKQRTFRRLTDKNGLANNTIYAILSDHAGHLWLSTNQGITKYAVEEDRFYNYNQHDGLQAGQFNPGSAVYNDLAGYMCFGGTSALNIFYPEQVIDKPALPKVMLSGFQLFNKAVKVGQNPESDFVLSQVIGQTREITLRHDQSVFTFDFVALDYSYPEKNQYAYKMEGLDRDWNYVGSQRFATYRYLPAGEYTFKVKASNQDNAWPNDYASITIHVLPPFWRTPLAYILYFIFIGCLLAAALYLRRKQMALHRRLTIEKAQRQRDQEMVKEKLSFFTEVSHEFRTPLTLMIGPLEEMMTREGTQSAMGRKLKMINRNAHKLLNLINKLLDYRKIESGNIVLKVSEEDVVPFVEEIYFTFQELAHRKHIQFTFHAADPALRVWFDREKLEMVITNILSNSFKYIGKGNNISISLRQTTHPTTGAEAVAIEIRDNGIGIARKHLDHIFDWFYKGQQATPMSSGIGLALAKKLVHLHKGEISVDSTEGNGSVFTILLPLGKDHFKPEERVTDSPTLPSDAHPADATPALVTVEEDTDAVTGRKGMRSLLIVEDDEDIRQFLREYFEPHYRILMATQGREGLTLAQEHHPDLIISDIMMPEMDGLTLCRELKANMRTSHIPVILLTARTLTAHHREGIETGADAYMTKPFSPEMLTLTMNNLLQSREHLKRFYRNLFTTTTPVPETPQEQSPDEKFLHTIHDILKAHLDHPDFNVNELGEALNMSRSLLYKKVKALTGLSPVEYLRSLRLQEAAQLLRSQQYKVFEVVYMVGFSDLKYFRQCFVKEFGCPPSEYLKNNLPRP